MSDYIFGFEKLEVYQLTKQFVKEIYLLTGNYPDKEKYGLVSQINRASVSVLSNLVEGNSRINSKEKGHFTQIAYSSLMEVLCQLDISTDIGYMTKDEYIDKREKIERIAKMLSGLRRRQVG